MTAPPPLAGRVVLVTRGAATEDRLGQLLEAAGAIVVRVPLIASERLGADGDLAAALERLLAARTAWIVVTSQNGAAILGEHLTAPRPPGVRVAAVGPATAEALCSRAVPVDLVAAGQTGEALARELAAHDIAGVPVLVLGAAGGGEEVPRLLAEAGAGVEVVRAYRSVLPAGAAEALAGALASTPPDAVTFTSGSTVRHFAAALGARPLPGCPAVCIGPVTAAAARAGGWVRVEAAAPHTAEGLAAAVVRVLATDRLP